MADAKKPAADGALKEGLWELTYFDKLARGTGVFDVRGGKIAGVGIYGNRWEGTYEGLTITATAEERTSGATQSMFLKLPISPKLPKGTGFKITCQSPDRGSAQHSGPHGIMTIDLYWVGPGA